MAQSAVTVTPPTPTPPTNFQFTGVTGPNPPNFTKLNYSNPVANPPPYYDDAAGGVINTVTFNTNKAALAGGTGATSGGTEDSYPGTGTGPTYAKPNNIGAVPAPTSAASEGAGAESVLTQAYAAGVLVPGDASTYTVSQSPAFAAGDAGGKLRTMGLTPAVALAAGALFSPNQSHASSLSPPANPTVTTFVPATNTVASGAGTMALQVNGTGFTPQTVIYVNGLPQTTVFTSSTRVDCPTCIKRATAGTYPVVARVAGAVDSAAVNYQWT